MAHRSRKNPKPSKSCIACGRPFEWRRKWADVWDEVKYCSQRCRQSRSRSANTSEARSR